MNLIFALTEAPGDSAWLSFRVAEPPAWVAWGFALSAVAAGVALGRRARVFWASLGSLAVFATLVALHPFAPRLPSGVLEVTTLDCGGGDALFVVLPDQTTLLMGAGGKPARGAPEGTFQSRRWDPGENVVSPYLWSRGIEKIDIVVLSDARDEHLTGMAAVLRNFRVGEFWNGANPLTRAYLDLLGEAQRRGITIREVGAGDRFANRETSALVLWPPREWAGIEAGAPTLSGGFLSRRPSRDDGLVLRISFGEASVLLHGDISEQVEKKLLSGHQPLESRTLQLASRTSRSLNAADFLASVMPSVALLSPPLRTPMAAASNETLRRLREAGIQAFRTDLDGAVTVEMQRRSVAVRTYLAPPAD